MLLCVLMAHMLQTHEPMKAVEAKRARAARTRCTVCRLWVAAAKPGDTAADTDEAHRCAACNHLYFAAATIQRIDEIDTSLGDKKPPRRAKSTVPLRTRSLRIAARTQRTSTLYRGDIIVAKAPVTPHDSLGYWIGVAMQDTTYTIPEEGALGPCPTAAVRWFTCEEEDAEADEDFYQEDTTANGHAAPVEQVDVNAILCTIERERPEAFTARPTFV